MSPPRYRAWRFLHPDLDVPEPVAGLQIAPQGNVEMVADGASVRQAILLLLSTVPGERVMRPEYGCELYRLVFSPNDGSTAGLAIHYVRRALERWEPRVEIIELDAGRNPSRPELLDIFLTYRVHASQRAEELTLTLNLAEGES
jgi:hypothetical protein